MASPLLRYTLLLFCLTTFQACTNSGDTARENTVLPVLHTGAPGRPAEMADAMEQIAGRIDVGVRNGEFTAAQVLVAHQGAILLEQSFGSLSQTPGAPVVTNESPFLVASITKPVTATAVMMLVEQGMIRLDDPVDQYIPEFSGGDRPLIHIRHLLNHTSGLPEIQKRIHHKEKNS